MGGLFALLDLEGIDIAAYVVSNLIGFVAGLYFLPNLLLSVLASVLISFHLFLAWLVITAKHDTGFSFPIVSTIFTHLCCLVVVIVVGFARNIPFFGIIRYSIPAIAIFERNYLFKAQTYRSKSKTVSVSKQEAEKKAATVANAVAAAATVDDYEEWLRYLAQPNRPPRKPGLSVQDEYKQWLVARARARALAESKRPDSKG